MVQRNHFLRSLSKADLALVQPGLEEVVLARDQILARTGRPVDMVYLPIDCVISVVVEMRDGRAVESRTIGCEGGYGLLHAVGSPMSFESVTCQISGVAFRTPLTMLRDAASRSYSLVETIARHAQASLLQSAQSTACNSLHTAEERLCRWLLLTRERKGSDILPLTQEHLSIMLGVQRTTITAVAQSLQARGLVSYSRGRIRLLEVQGLKDVSCECYDAIEENARRILAGR
jgi:CRP-like cAMP-binding protein